MMERASSEVPLRGFKKEPTAFTSWAMACGISSIPAAPNIYRVYSESTAFTIEISVLGQLDFCISSIQENSKILN